MKTGYTLLLCCLWFYGTAQRKSAPYYIGRAVSFNPVVLVAVDRMIMAGVERRFCKGWSFIMDAGYVYSTYHFSHNVTKNTRGYALRPGIKYFLKKQNKEYYAAQLFYKQVDYTLEDWLGKASVNGTPTYEQFQTFTYRKKAMAFTIMAGELFHLSNVVLLDLYAGVGVQVRNQRPLIKGAQYRANEVGIFNRYREHAVLPMLPVGVKLLFNLN